MRLPGIALVVSLLPDPAISGEVPSLDGLSSANTAPLVEYQLGGSATRSNVQRLRLPSASDAPPRLRVSVPRLVRETSETVQPTPFGGLRLYFGEAWTDGDDVFQLGTALTRGQTTAGVSVTYQGDLDALTNSELYLDYAVTSQFSIGISGGLSDTLTQDAEPLPQLGVNAELNTEAGTYLRGGVADAGGRPPVFGVAIGLRF